MEYHFWDMDHTIIDNDCDVSWKEFLIATGRAPVEAQKEVDRFFREYEQNVLAVEEFMAFQLREVAGQTLAGVRALTLEHFDTVVKDKIYPEAARLISAQLVAGHLVGLLTATNRPVAEPLAEHLGIPHVLATELELNNGVYTGRVAGAYCGGPGKAERLAAFCGERGVDLGAVHYYGDSTSDQYVLRMVGHPVVVNPMPPLRELAEAHNWPVLDFKN